MLPDAGGEDDKDDLENSGDCRKVKCPDPKKVITDPKVLRRANEMYKQTLKDGRERGVVVYNGPNGTLRIGPTILRTARGPNGEPATVPGLARVPDNAIAALHTHPRPGTDDYIGPSGRDSVHAADNHVMAVVRDQGGAYILTSSGSAAYVVPVSP